MRGLAGQPASLILRSHQEGAVTLQVRFGTESRTIQLAATPPSELSETTLALPARAVSEKNLVVIRPTGKYASYHYFVVGR